MQSYKARWHDLTTSVDPKKNKLDAYVHSLPYFTSKAAERFPNLP